MNVGARKCAKVDVVGTIINKVALRNLSASMNIVDGEKRSGEK
jgi:hypothetical protein